MVKLCITKYRNYEGTEAVMTKIGGKTALLDEFDMSRYINYTINYIFRDISIHVICLIMSIFPTATTINYFRGFLVGLFLGKCGKRFQLGKGVIINHPELLYIGDDCYISHNCYVQARGSVTFGNNVIIGPMSIIASSNHMIIDGMVTNKGESKPISIGDGTWLGGGRDNHCGRFNWKIGSCRSGSSRYKKY